MTKLCFLLIVFPVSLLAQDKITESFINRKIDEWHKAASTANADLFFDFMADDAIYIGTDKTERWTKAAFYEFAKPYFDKGKAWDFTPYERHIMISEDGTTIWFSELLNTWMGICRGSGIITNSNGEWKLRQYHLAVTVPNEIIQDFIALVEGHEK